MKRNYLKEFISLEASSGIILLLAAVLALALENSPLQSDFHHLLHLPLGLAIGPGGLVQPLHFWINDALMAIFFLVVGLEIKRERIEGHLASRPQFLLPAIAACGGVVMPALIFTLLNYETPELLRGWAIPTATDIAFALCVMQLLGRMVPHGLKVTLVTIAIIDDLIAVMIIALFYTDDLNLPMLGAAALILLILGWLNKRGVKSSAPYLVAGLPLWYCVWQSGVHATVAGVMLAMVMPLALGKKLEKALHSYVAYAIMPLFALANSGLPLTGLTVEDVLQPLPLGILLGLFFGKQAGVMLASFLSVKLRICSLPQGTHWKQYYGMAVLCGIGFTMSLFIGGLAYDAVQQNAVRLGVLAGSLLAAVSGYLMLRIMAKTRS